MLSIRDQQLDDLKSESRRAFLEKLAAHLRSSFAKQLGEARPEDVQAFVESTATRAEARRMTSKEQIRRFAEVVVAARDGLEDGAEPERLEKILEDDGAGPRQKLTLLEDWLLFEEGR